jgi:hypothetical protein
MIEKDFIWHDNRHWVLPMMTEKPSIVSSDSKLSPFLMMLTMSYLVIET